MWRSRKLRLVTVAAAVAAVTLVPAAAFADAPGAESPEALVDKMRTAAENEDFNGLMDCLAPDARNEMMMAMYLGATMFVAFAQMGVEMGGAMGEGLSEDASAEDKAKMEAQMAEAKAEAQAMIDRYNEVVAAPFGLPEMTEEGEEPDVDPEELFSKIDAAAFMQAVMGFMGEFGEEEEGGGGGSMMDSFAVGELVGLQVDGDTAAGTIDDQPIQFVKIDGRWFVDAEGMGG